MRYKFIDPVKILEKDIEIVLNEMLDKISEMNCVPTQIVLTSYDYDCLVAKLNFKFPEYQIGDDEIIYTKHSIKTHIESYKGLVVVIGSETKITFLQVTSMPEWSN
jgi:hypothetical protein